MLAALILLVCWPIAELYVAIKVADAIGVLETVLLLVASWPIGTWALRSQGRSAWSRLAAAVNAGRNPGREVLDGALVLIGGMLLIVPGFITDALGVWLLAPPSRAVVRRLLSRHLQSRLVMRAVGVRRRPVPYDVDSTARDIDQPQLRP